MDISNRQDKDRPSWMLLTTTEAAIARAAINVVHEALEAVEVHPCDVHDEAVRAAGLVEPTKSLYQALKNAGVKFYLPQN